MTHRIIGKVPRKRKRSLSRTPTREEDVHAQRSPLTVATLARADGPHPTSILTPPTEASPPQCTLLSLPHALLESVLRCFDYCSLQQLGGVCSLFHSSLRLTAFSLSILRACSCSLPSSLAALHRLHHGSKQQRYQALHNPLYRALFALDATLQQHDRYMDTWRRMKGEMTGRHSKPSSGGSGRRRAAERGRPWERGWRAMRAWVKEEDPTVHRWLWGDTPVITVYGDHTSSTELLHLQQLHLRLCTTTPQPAYSRYNAAKRRNQSPLATAATSAHSDSRQLLVEVYGAVLAVCGWQLGVLETAERWCVSLEWSNAAGCLASMRRECETEREWCQAELSRQTAAQQR